MPGTTALTLGNEELSVNLMDRVKEMRAMNAHPYQVAEDMLKNMDTADGGERVVIPWETEDHSIAQRIRNGYEKLTLFGQTTMTPGLQGWGIVVQPVLISEVDEKKNSGKVALFKLLDKRVANVERHFRRQLQTGLLRGFIASGTHPGVAGWEDFLSLNGGDTALGIIEDQATGTNVLHNVSKGSFPPAVAEQFHNYFADVGADVGGAGLPALYGSMLDAQIKEGDAWEPGASFWYWSRLFAGHVKTTMRTAEYYTTDGDLDDGKRKAHSVYGGIKVRVVAEMPNTGSASTAKPWSALRVNWKEGVRFRGMPGWSMDWSPFENVNQGVGARYAYLRLWGQLIGQQPGLCSLLVDGEAI